MGNRTPSLSESSSAGKWSSKLPTPRSDFMFTIGLAGTADAGKTTLRKQLLLHQIASKSPAGKLILDSKLSDDYKNLILKTMWEGLGLMATYAWANHKDLFLQDISKEANEELWAFYQSLKKLPESLEIDAIVGKRMYRFWKAPIMQKVWTENRKEISGMSCNLDYFMSRVSEICKPSWNPSEMDILRVSTTTYGTIHEEKLQIDGLKFKILDFGGASYLRSQFRNQVIPRIDSIFFVVNLADYHMKSADDDGINRMQDSLSYWQELLDLEAPSSLKTVSAFLVFTQAELFAKKLRTVPLSADAFPEYKGPDTADAAFEYVKESFIAKIGIREGKLLQCSGDFMILDSLKVQDAVDGFKKLLHMAARRHRDSSAVETDPF